MLFYIYYNMFPDFLPFIKTHNNFQQDNMEMRDLLFLVIRFSTNK
jgi:hypothetical protein